MSAGSRAVLDFAFPPRCPITEEHVQRHGTFSPSGWAGLSHYAPPWCPVCARPADPLSPACEGCEGDKAAGLTPAIDRIRAAVRYDEGIAQPILKLKYASRHDGVAAFGAMMAQAGQDLFGPNAVLVPVPLHPSRLRERGYNQAGVLAKAISARTGVPVAQDLLTRTRKTRGQGTRSPEARRAEVEGAFAAADKARIARRDIVLVDDVLTTGATLAACAWPLRRARAGSVSALVLARVASDLVAVPNDPT